MGYSHLVSKIGVIDLELQSHFDLFDSEFQETAFYIAFVYMY